MLELPDIIWIKILKLLSSHELMVASQAIPKLNSVRSRHKALWGVVDFSGHRMKLEEMQDMLEMLHRDTVSLTLEGFGRLRPHIQDVYLKSTKTELKLSDYCETLRKLTIQKVTICPGNLKLDFIPWSLTHLSLFKCHLYRGFFNHIRKILTGLEYLRIEDVTMPDAGDDASDFKSLEEHQNLRTLSVSKCGDFRPCPSDSYEFVFPGLQVLDLSETDITGWYLYIHKISRI